MSEIQADVAWTRDMLRRTFGKSFAELAENAPDVFAEAVRTASRDVMNEVWIDSPKWLRRRIQEVLGVKRR